MSEQDEGCQDREVAICPDCQARLMLYRTNGKVIGYKHLNGWAKACHHEELLRQPPGGRQSRVHKPPSSHQRMSPE